LVAYFNMSQDNDFNEINVFNIYFLFTTIIYYFILLGYSVISNKMKIYHSVLCISVFFMYFGRNFAILSYRMPEFFNIVLVLLIPEIIKYVKEKWIVVITILCFCLFMIYYYTIRHPLINIASS
jgi:hypothetical protein